DRGEIVDEVERVLDLVRYSRSELAERSKLLGLDQAILSGAQVIQRPRQFSGALLDFLKQSSVLNGDKGLICKSGGEFYLLLAEGAYDMPRQDEYPDGDSLSKQRHTQHRTNVGASSGRRGCIFRI